MTERLEDALSRIAEIGQETCVPGPCRDFFAAGAEFAGLLGAFLRETAAMDIMHTDQTAVLKRWNSRLYEESIGDYEESPLDPEWAVQHYGIYGRIFSVLFFEMYNLIPGAYEKHYGDITAVLETFIQIYCMFRDAGEECTADGEQRLPDEKNVRDVLYSYVYDDAYDILKDGMDQQYLPEKSYLGRLLNEAEFRTSDDLYRCGYYVSQETVQTGDFIGSLPDDTIDAMAETWYDGFKEGFVLQGKPYEKKGTAELRFTAGFERVAKRTAELFMKDGIAVTVPRRRTHFLNRTPSQPQGMYVSPNRQMDEDHSYDAALVMGDRITAHMLDIQNTIFASYGEAIMRYAGPVVMESFGEAAFDPICKKEAPQFSPHQSEAYGKYRNACQLLVHRYILEEERSFTIIAWPVPAIGPAFPEIFEEMLKINTLPKKEYGAVQQKLIDALDKACYAEIRGQGNETDLRVSLQPLKVPEKESNFENCLADVNIPLGEVFTTPALEGTEGMLHVHSVFIEGTLFQELRIRFENGRVSSYSCSNFEDPEAGRALIRKVIFGEKEGLPMGEFAIGTNTEAYRMMTEYQIGGRMPILITEKTGPHFAVGDTCYAFMEDMKLYNPDGKELTAKDNACTKLRTSAPEKAYFAVHTDITVPYNELDSITAVTAQGERIPVISHGRFVLPGTEMLNKSLEREIQK